MTKRSAIAAALLALLMPIAAMASQRIPPAPTFPAPGTITSNPGTGNQNLAPYQGDTQGSLSSQNWFAVSNWYAYCGKHSSANDDHAPNAVTGADANCLTLPPGLRGLTSFRGTVVGVRGDYVAIRQGTGSQLYDVTQARSHGTVPHRLYASRKVTVYGHRDDSGRFHVVAIR